MRPASPGALRDFPWDTMDGSRGVAQPGSAPALGERPPLPTALSRFVVFQCFQQLGESAFAQNASQSCQQVGFCDSFATEQRAPAPDLLSPLVGSSAEVSRESGSSIRLART